MAPRTVEQNRQIADRKKQHIKRIALELFAREGYYCTPVSKIALYSDISKGLLYNYFESKEDLLQQIILEGFEKVEILFDRSKYADLSENELTFFINETVKLLKTNLHYLRLYFTIIQRLSTIKLVEEKLENINNTISKTLINYFERKGYENPKTESQLFIATIYGMAFNYHISPDNYPLDYIASVLLKKYA